MIDTANILVVEDNPDFQELLTTFLIHAGHEVSAAENAEEARRLNENQKFAKCEIIAKFLILIIFFFLTHKNALFASLGDMSKDDFRSECKIC